MWRHKMYHNVFSYLAVALKKAETSQQSVLEFIFLFPLPIRTYLGPKKFSRKFCDVQNLQKNVANG